MVHEPQPDLAPDTEAPEQSSGLTPQEAQFVQWMQQHLRDVENALQEEQPPQNLTPPRGKKPSP